MKQGGAQFRMLLNYAIYWFLARALYNCDELIDGLIGRHQDVQLLRASALQKLELFDEFLPAINRRRCLCQSISVLPLNKMIAIVSLVSVNRLHAASVRFFYRFSSSN